MTPAPGVVVTSGEDSAASSPRVDFATRFIAGLTEKGPVDRPSLVESMGLFRTALGGRTTYSSLIYDWAETFFREGGRRLYVGRKVGPDYEVASGNLVDGTSANTLHVVATSPGDWANSLSIVITVPSAGLFDIEVKLSGVRVQRTATPLNNNAEAVAWAATSPYIRLTEQGAADPKAQTVTLTGGDDDRASAGDAQGLAALELFTPDLGPGLEVLPGQTTEASAANLAAHCSETGRTGRVDAPDSEDIADAISLALAIRALPDARRVGVFWPWAIIPGLAQGTDRTVPYSAVDAGITARNAALGVSPNQASAGIFGIARYAYDLSQPKLSEDDRETASAAGVNIAKIDENGKVRTYGYRTPVNGLVDDTWLLLANADLEAYIKAKCKAIGERFVFQQIDGRGRLAAKFAAAIEGEILAPLYEKDSLFGELPEDAYEVDVSDQVNTEETIAEGKLRAIVKVVMSEAAEMVEIEVVKEAI